MVCAVENQLNFRKLLTIAVSVVVVSTLLILPYGSYTVNAQAMPYDFISEPGKIPMMSNWKTPVIEPGETGVLMFSITNRYNEFNLDSNNITDVELTLGIYEYATLAENRRVDTDFDFMPEIEKEISIKSSGTESPPGTPGIITIEPETGIKLFKFQWPILPENTTYDLELQISSDDDTPQGVYFIKTELIFRHSGIENKSFIMRSKGFYSDEEWEHAKQTVHEDFVPGINLTSLGIDGIIPETSFTVDVPTPTWPMYPLVGLAVFFVFLAIIFYYMEEHDKFPNFKKKLDGFGKRIK
jgi:hypothetical protein